VASEVRRPAHPQGQPTARQLTLELNELEGVLEVTADDVDDDAE
jgi:hypothetical protein